MQTGFKQTWKQQKIRYSSVDQIPIETIIMKSRFHQRFGKMNISIKDDKYVWEYWQNMMTIQSRNAKVILSKVYFSGFLGCEVANKFTAEQLLVCGCQRCTHLNISLFALSQSRFDLQLGAPGWCGVLQKEMPGKGWKLKDFNIINVCICYLSSRRTQSPKQPSQRAQLEICWKPSYLILALGAGAVWWQVKRL